MSLFLIARVKVKYGHMVEAANILAKMVPLIEPHGWKLLGSYHPVIGDFSEIIDIWEVADANAVPKALEEMAAGDIPGFGELFMAFREHVESEMLQVCAKFPFSP